MQKILVLFNLREGVDPSQYEAWARDVDLPTARGLDAVTSFNVYRSAGLMRTGEPGPYQYAEWLQITSPEALGADAQSEAMQAVIKAFGEYADNPQFILMNDIE